MPRYTLDDIEKQKKPKQNFQSLPPQTEIDINEKDTPEGTDPKWLGGSILMFIVSLVLWISFVLMDEDYLTRITNPEGDMTTLDFLSFLPFCGMFMSGILACSCFITSKNPKLVEEWKEWNLKEEMRKNNPNQYDELVARQKVIMAKALSEGDKLTAPKEVGLTDSSKGSGLSSLFAVGIGLVVIGMFFLDLSLDSSLFYPLGLGIGALGTLILSIWAMAFLMG